MNNIWKRMFRCLGWGLSIILWTCPALAQGDSLVDVFPLQIGRQWVYDYKQSSGDEGGGASWHGTIAYNVVDSSDFADSTVWTLRVIRFVAMHASNGLSETWDDTTLQTLFEDHGPNHRLHNFRIDAGDNPPSVFTFDPALTETTKIYRFAKVDSEGIAYVHSSPARYGYIYDLYFKKNIGLTRSMSQKIILVAGYRTTDHILDSTNILSVGSEYHNKVNRFSLDQNYPNPFNPTTTVSYHISKLSVVNLSVFNVLGQKIKDLNLGVEEPGAKSMRIDAGELPSGIYFYRLEATSVINPADHFSETRKMLLVR